MENPYFKGNSIALIKGNAMNLYIQHNKLMKINNLADVERQWPGRINAIKDWFKYIKTFDGKKCNVIYKDGKLYDVDQSLQVIKENHL